MKRDARTSAETFGGAVGGGLPRAGHPEQAGTSNQSETIFRQLFESYKDGILIVDADDATVVDANPAFMKLFGYTHRQFVGQPVGDIEALGSIIAGPAEHTRLREEANHLAETTLTTPEGRHIHAEVSSNIYRANGRRLLYCNIRDIDARKRAELAEHLRLTRARNQLEAIGKISASEAILEGDVERLAREITEEATRVTGVERANVWLFNEDESELRCIDLYESSARRHSAGMILKQSEFENEFRALKNTSYVAADDPYTDPRTEGYVENYLKPLGITSMLDTVIEVSERHVGLLCLEHVGKAHAWQADEIAFAGRLADKIPMAITNRIRKRTAALLTAAERMACIGGYDWDIERDLLLWSEELCRIFGQDPARYTPSVTDFVASVHPDDRQRLEHVIAGARSGEIPAEIEYRIRRADGTERVILSHSEIQRAPSGKAIRITGTSQDITERKRSEDRLRESQQLLERIINAISVPVFWKDRDLRYLGCNAAFARDAGFDDPRDLIGKDDYQMAWRDEAELYRNDDRQVIASGRSKGPIEQPQTTPQGDTITLLTNKVPFRGSDGSIVGILGTYLDITERKRSEETMLRAIGALKTLSSCSTALVHATGELSLLNEICRIIAVMSGYPLVWVAIAEHDSEKSIRAAAHAGHINGVVERAGLTWDDEAAQGPVSAAIRSGQVQLIENAHTDPRYEPWRESAIKAGYRSVLCLPLASDDVTFGALCIYSAARDAFDDQEIRLLSGLAKELAFGIVGLRARTEHQQSMERLRRGMESTIAALAGTLELRDAYTAGHQRRVAELAAAIAREMGIPEEQDQGIQLAATVHDLGKILVPAEILTKPTRLSALEFEMVKTHAKAGYDILKDIDFPWPIAELVYQHHERLDGSGYPRGLTGKDTLLGAKILAVADTIEAMSSHRPYRAGLGIEASLAELTKQRDKLYDPAVVDACLEVFRKRFSFSA